MKTWRETIARIRQVKVALSATKPGQGPSLIPPAGATLRAISTVERRIGRRLPPSYRDFLHEHDGWPLFYGGASLLGTRELGRPYADTARAVYASHEAPIPEIGPPGRSGDRPRAMIPFGFDPEGSTLFAFNPGLVRADGEMEVISWVHDLGERSETFGAFLELVFELLEAELLESDRAPSALKKSA